MRSIVAITLCVALCGAAVTANDDTQHHRHRHHKAPLETEESDVLESLVGQEHLQLEPATATTSLSDSGPLTRADYGGEAPYETREIVEENSGDQQQVDFVDAPQYHTADVATEASEADVSAVDIENTVPRLLPDGRLVRVPKTGAPDGTRVTEVKVPKPQRVAEDADQNEQLSAPDNADQVTFSKVAGQPKRLEDVEALEVGEGVSLAQDIDCSVDPSQMGCPAYVAPTFPVTPKVRVSSLVGGILSSVLSSVLTRGMNFASADFKET